MHVYDPCTSQISTQTLPKCLPSAMYWYASLSSANLNVLSMMGFAPPTSSAAQHCLNSSLLQTNTPRTDAAE